MHVNSLKPAVHIDASAIPLEHVASSTQLTQEQKVKEASRAFEAVLLRQILQEGQRPLFKSKYVGNSTADSIYRDQVANLLAESISKSGSLGLGKSLARELQRHATTAKSGATSALHAVNGRVPPAGRKGLTQAQIPPGKVPFSTKRLLLLPPKHD